MSNGPFGTITGWSRDECKRPCTVNLDEVVILRLDDLAKALDRTRSWLVNNVLREKLGLPLAGGKVENG